MNKRWIDFMKAAISLSLQELSGALEDIIHSQRCQESEPTCEPHH